MPYRWKTVFVSRDIRCISIYCTRPQGVVPFLLVVGFVKVSVRVTFYFYWYRSARNEYVTGVTIYWRHCCAAKMEERHPLHVGFRMVLSPSPGPHPGATTSIPLPLSSCSDLSTSIYHIYHYSIYHLTMRSSCFNHTIHIYVPIIPEYLTAVYQWWSPHHSLALPTPHRRFTGQIWTET